MRMFDWSFAAVFDSFGILRFGTQLTREVTSVVFARPNKACNFIQYKGLKIVYRRYENRKGTRLNSIDTARALARSVSTTASISWLLLLLLLTPSTTSPRSSFGG